MAGKSYQNPHAKREAELARLIAQESLVDMYGGEETIYNGTGLIVGLATALFLLVIVASGVYWLLV